MKPAHRVMFVAGLLVLAALTWGWLTRTKPAADWLLAEGPGRVTPGGKIIIRVTPVGVDEHLQLNVDLHGTTRRQHPLRLLSHGRPQRVGALHQQHQAGRRQRAGKHALQLRAGAENRHLAARGKLVVKGHLRAPLSVGL